MWWAFLAVTVPLVLTPGASTAVVLRNSLSGGTRAGVQTAIGINAGSFCYGLLSAFGVALALQHWPGVWAALRTLGVLYLAWLGVRSLQRGLQPPAPELAARTDGRPLTGAGDVIQNVREGFITNALNPAIATFYFVIVPQFVPRGAPVVRGVIVLTVVHIALAASWHVAWAAAGGRLSGMLSAGRPRQVLDVTAGAALLALAVRLWLG